ncbi:hypothetical protein NC652_036492 [Populus alba x Populus x berolinensis]|nr:hypothetical protein NC652_036490 [Populus alba x Populus x berolinensis]KAJ6870841.1 hypothetical protein NC652_036492 [Populus alba x Populus x berolinensis]
MIITLHRYSSVTQTLNHLPSGCPRTRSLFQGGKKVAFKLWRMDAVGKMRKFEAFLWLRFFGTCVCNCVGKSSFPLVIVSVVIKTS